MLAAAALIGASRVLQPTSGSLQRALPDILVLVWFVLILVASTTALVGIFWKVPTTGLRIEQAGLVVMASVCIVYTIVLIVVGGWGALAAAGFVMGFAGAAAVRAWDIGRILNRIHALALATEVVLNEEESKE
jgi:hypothetical protein